MDFCHLIVTCLFSMRRLPFDNQKVKGNYAILLSKPEAFHLFSGFLSDYWACWMMIR